MDNPKNLQHFSFDFVFIPKCWHAND